MGHKMPKNSLFQGVGECLPKIILWEVFQRLSLFHLTPHS